VKVEGYEAETQAVDDQAYYRAKLEALKREKFPPEGKEERIARALAALHRSVRSEEDYQIKLTPEQWKEIVENPDLEDQF
jgi:hypothetical protein